MKLQKKTNQEICDLVKSDIRVIAAVQKVEENEDKTINTSLENGVLKVRITKGAEAGQRTTTRKIKIG